VWRRRESGTRIKPFFVEEKQVEKQGSECNFPEASLAYGFPSLIDGAPEPERREQGSDPYFLVL